MSIVVLADATGSIAYNSLVNMRAKTSLSFNR